MTSSLILYDNWKHVLCKYHGCLCHKSLMSFHAISSQEIHDIGSASLHFPTTSKLDVKKIHLAHKDHYAHYKYKSCFITDLLFGVSHIITIFWQIHYLCYTGTMLNTAFSEPVFGIIQLKVCVINNALAIYLCLICLHNSNEYYTF